ncbi:Oidioi.mRNA.OKI2018_I69.chr1.g862.t1.cds [Oikopleura dioica]|uniref:Oidioi.mRNA.OKI2018_I69.chr1.g862.t1.cds n=1 Tax=Oikopleura dioica TaxID=34765 RepID=A0ABN7SLR8_OIKDI|nr:Oidioi.mRNA.OKI2018_I69.chr1.g862.t1.cds [Oikopleura dioica]
MDWGAADCPDYVKIEPQSELGEILDTVYFCGSGDAATSYFIRDGEKNFIPRQKFGLKGWDHAWDTFAKRATVTFSSDSEGNGGNFKILVGEQLRSSPCRTRSDCQHVDLTQHICAINDETKEKVCTKVDCTSHDHCKKGENPGDPIEICSKNKCEPTECRLREHCPEQHVCKDNECTLVDCTKHDHCDQSAGPKRCTKNVCTSVGCVGKKDCLANQLCVENECVSHECLGHLTCENDFPERCKDGICKCIGRKCEKQECTKHTHCPDGGLCDNNPFNDPTFKCYNEVDGVKTCRNHAQCGAKAKCQDKRCVSVECRTNKDCEGKKGAEAWRCFDENTAPTVEQQNTCYPVDCSRHDTCGAKKACKDNTCVDVTCRTNADCTGNFLCHKPDRSDPTKNFCKAVDCIGHKACKEHSNIDCQNGKCLCIKNKCEAQQCVTSDHCGSKQRCHDNKCEDAQCSNHDHCLTFFPKSNGVDYHPAKCFPNCYTEKGRKYCLPECRKVACRTHEHCGPKQLCDKTKNQCKNVDCRGHDHCGDKESCVKNVCTLQTCTKNWHCKGEKEVCENNECKQVGCKGHDDCGEKERCIRHECVARECTLNEHCSKSPGNFEKCDKIDGTCIDIECIGHTSCNNVKLNSFGDDCSDGHCLCLGNVCHWQECRTNDHCDVDCLGHADCDNFKGDTENAYYCKNQKCEPIQCRVTADCGDKEVCKNRECQTVACTEHSHCEEEHDDTYSCLSNTCTKQQCRNNQHCNSNQLCNKAKGECYDVECRGNLMCDDKEGCEDGKCLCLDNVCEVQECRKDAHCGEKGVCEKNQCVQLDCKTDEHCLDDNRKPCRDGKCRCNLSKNCEPVSCMENTHCAADEVCSGDDPNDGIEDNTCISVECKSINDCGDQEICEKNTCKLVECTTSSHCADRSSPHVCRKNKCEPVECAAHDDCADFFPETEGLGYKCIKNKCKNFECTTNFHCGEGQLCNKSINECYAPECIGSLACDSLATTEGGENCLDGRCRCEANKCVKKECRDNTHCGWPQKASICQNNKCNNVPCTSHSHCQNADGGNVASRCVDGNKCDHSGECLVTNHCDSYDEPHVCRDNQCVPVPCLRNSDCGDQHICVRQECVKVECDSNIDCEKGQICVDNLCVE